jgi:periplasmic protein TonB
MTVAYAAPPLVTRPEFFRWGTCAAVVLAAHGLVVLAVATHPDAEQVEAGSPVVMVELAPLSVAPPAPQRDLAAGPLLDTESQDRVAEEARPDRTEPEKERVIEETPAPNPEVTMPQATPQPEKPEEKPAPEPVEAVPVPTAPQTAPMPAVQTAAPAVGAAVRPTSAVIASWQRLLVAALERHKRYPPQGHGKRGEARLAFSIDRQGHVLTSRIVHSSGSGALDEEALALVKRAEPLPAPPAGLPDNQLSFVVPIRYH